MQNNEMSDAVIIERAHSIANEAMWTVVLQHRRIRAKEPEDGMFVFRWWVDLQFFILALYRLRTAVKIARNISAISFSIDAAISQFDKDIPDLKKLRDIGEHIDEYAVDSQKRHDKSVDRKQLQVGTWKDPVYEWLDVSLNVDNSKIAAEKLFRTLQKHYKEACNANDQSKNRAVPRP
jgi:hypothetical protein